MNTELARRAQLLVEAASKKWAISDAGRRQVEYVELHYNGYAEPGYNGEIVATANWNVVTKWDAALGHTIDVDPVMRKLSEALEKIGVAIEWSDEWTDCSDCSKLVRTSGDSWGWTSSWYEHDGEIICRECAQNDPSAYLETLEGDEHAAATIGDIDPAEHEYVLVEKGYERGLHPGQDADPKLIAAALRKQGVTRFLFRIDDVGQFDARFSVYVHADETELLDREAFAAEETDGPSVSAAAERGLREASRVMGTLPDGGVKYVAIEGDTVVDARTISPRDFAEKGTSK